MAVRPPLQSKHWSPFGPHDRMVRTFRSDRPTHDGQIDTTGQTDWHGRSDRPLPPKLKTDDAHCFNSICKTHLPIDARCTQGMKTRFLTSCKTHLPTFRIMPQGIRYRDLNHLQNAFANSSHMLQGLTMSLNYLQNAFANIGNMLKRARASTTSYQHITNSSY